MARTEAIRQAFTLGGTDEEALRAAINSMAQSVCSEKEHNLQLRLMTNELAQPSPALDRVIDQVSRPLYSRFRGPTGRMIGLPIDHKKTRHCTHSVVGQIVHYSHTRPFIERLRPEREMTPSQVECIAQHIADLSLAYMRQAGSRRLKGSTARRHRSKK